MALLKIYNRGKDSPNGLALLLLRLNKDNYKQNFEKYPLSLPHSPKKLTSWNRSQFEKNIWFLFLGKKKKKKYSFYDTEQERTKKLMQLLK